WAEIAVIAAHPDDEVIGCGGTMAKHASAGDHVHVLIMAEGATSRDARRDVKGRRREVSALRDAAEEAGRILRIQSVEFAGFPDNQLDNLPLLELVKRVEAFLTSRRPSVIYTHHSGDLNVDHVMTSRAVATA